MVVDCLDKLIISMDTNLLLDFTETMNTPQLDAALKLMTQLGVQPTQAEAFIEVIRNPSLITDEASLIQRFSNAGYEQGAATALALFLMDEKAHGRL